MDFPLITMEVAKMRHWEQIFLPTGCYFKRVRITFVNESTPFLIFFFLSFPFAYLVLLPIKNTKTLTRCWGHCQ